MISSKRIILGGAAPDTGNLGVSALLESMLSGLSKKEKYDFVVFDHSRGLRKRVIKINKKDLEITLCGAKHGKKIYQFENFTNIRFSLNFSGAFNPIAKYIMSSNVMLDISGGDSFTDLYGEWRFNAITLPKLIAIENNIPLILMPQTYGPYINTESKRIAEKIVKSSTIAYARDAESFEVLKELLGNEFDKNKHLQGVDIAFLLDVSKPVISLSKTIEEWLGDPKIITIGINVSGLIYNQIEKSYSQYGFKANYQDVIHQFIKRILDKTDVNIVLISHVQVDEEHYESDLIACKKVINQFSELEKRRIDLITNNYEASEVKWIISQVNWFCGTRMHSTIAGLSTMVPTAAIAYSIKTLRVFKTCGQENQVIDPREMGTSDVVDGLWNCWLQRGKTKQSLAKHLPNVIDLAKKQMEFIKQKVITL